MNFGLFKVLGSAEKHVYETACAEERVRIEAAIVKAEALDDPAEKILRLGRIESDICGVIYNRQENIERRAGRKGENADLAVSLSSDVGGLIALSVATHGLFLAALPIVLTGNYLGGVVSRKRSAGVRKMLSAHAADHLQYLAAQKQNLALRKEEIVRACVDEISRSPLFDEAIGRQGLAAVFADAAARQRALKEEEIAALKDAQARQEQKAEAQKNRAAGYERLIGVFDPQGGKPKPAR